MGLFSFREDRRRIRVTGEKASKPETIGEHACCTVRVSGRTCVLRVERPPSRNRLALLGVTGEKAVTREANGEHGRCATSTPDRTGVLRAGRALSRNCLDLAGVIG